MEAEIKGIKERSISKRIGQQTIYKKVKENVDTDTQTSTHYTVRHADKYTD